MANSPKTPQEQEVVSLNVTVELDGEKLEILPVNKWSSSAVHALRNGDTEAWAAKALTPESYEIWQEIDPTLDEIEQFFSDWSDISGNEANLSRQQRRRSRSTRTR